MGVFGLLGCEAEPAVERQGQAVLTDPGLLRPILECVDEIDTSHFVAHFGYRNTAAEDVAVGIGAQNKFTPAPVDRGQPTTFLPGRHVDAFQVAFNGSNLVWTLGPRTTTASASTKRCVVPDAGSDAAPPNLCVPPPAGLDDGDPCTVDACNPATGQVSHTFSAALPGCASAPDLVIRSIDPVATNVDPATFAITGTVSVLVANDGTGTTRSATTLALFEDRNDDKRFNSGTDVLFGDGPVPVLAPGATSLVGVSVSGEVSFPGNLMAGYVDPGSLIPESNEENNAADTRPPCLFVPRVHPFTPKLKWAWTGSTLEPGFSQVRAGMAVADLTGDGVPEVIVPTHAGNGYGEARLRALDGRTGEERWISAPRVVAGSPPAVGDIDGDGLPEVVTLVFDGERQVVAFEHTGAIKWKSPQLPRVPGGTFNHVSPVALADLDGDAEPEIVVGATVLNADGSLRWHGELGQGMQRWFTNVASIADLDLDGMPEVVAGHTAYRADGSPYWHRPDILDGWTGIADLDDDGLPEVVLSNQEGVTVLRHDGTDAWRLALGEGWMLGPPAIGDLDGDGSAEIVVNGSYFLYALRGDGTTLWTADVLDGSGITGAVLFDFDGDSAMDVLYQDEVYAYVVAGRTGEVLWKTAHSSGTTMEFPVVADVDGDGRAEFIIGSEEYNRIGYRGFRVFGSAYDDWTVTRAIWNQNAYHVSNVNDDFTIPPRESPSWLSHNTYRAQKLTVGCPDARPDFIPSRLRVVGNTATVRVGNAGSLKAVSGVPVSFYASDPRGGGPVLGTVRTAAPILPGKYVEVSFIVPTGIDVADLHAVADDRGDGVGESTEHDELNNFTRVPSNNRPPTVDLGPDRMVPFDQPLVIAAGISDDGLPAPARLTLHWSQSSGPAAAAFSHPDSPTSQVTFPVPGTYVLQATANDGVIGVSDAITLTVIDPALNAAPVVDAGLDTVVQVGLPLQLTGTIEDDGLPAATLAATWSVVDGPGPVAFGDASVPGTTATFSVEGPYLLRLTASDGMLASSSDVMVTVAKVVGTNGNQPPDASGAEISARVGEVVPLAPFWGDDGLPVGGVLTARWIVLEAPGQVFIDDPTAFWTTASFDTVGDYTLVIVANDGELSNSGQWKIHVTRGPNAAPLVSAMPDIFVTLPTRTVSLAPTVTDDGQPAGAPIRLQWSVANGSGVAVFSSPNTAATTVTFDAPGGYTFRLSADDTALVGEGYVRVFVEPEPGNGTPPAVALAGLDDVPSVTKPIAVTGTISASSSVAWRLETRESGGDGPWTLLALGDQPVTNGTLATFDPTLLLNGTYDLRLTATGGDGLATEVTKPVVVEDNFKVGHFTLTFVDAEVPVAGMPIQVLRTYDSRDTRRRDFGHGWSLDVSRVRVHESGLVGKAFKAVSDGAFVPTWCIVPGRKTVVTVTTPDGKVHKFEPIVEDGCALFSPPDVVTVAFRALPGTTSSLSLPGGADALVLVEGGEVELLDFTFGTPLDPRAYELTLLDGRALAFDQFDGFQSITDLNGNTLTFSSYGIFHSSGKFVGIQRDSLGRITTVTTPDGAFRRYTYDLDGNLATYEDEVSQTTRFAYHANLRHHLVDVIDARGVQALRNDYDDDGRLISTTDALGKTIAYAHDLDNRREVIVDRNLNQRVLEYDDRGNVVRETDQEGKVTTRTFDERNNRLTETDPTLRTRRWVYDANDLVIEEIDPANQSTVNTYDSHGRLLTTTDPLLHTWTNTYDAKGNLLTTVGPVAGQITTNTYDSQGNLRTTTDALNHVTTYEYDSFGNRTKEIDALAHATTFTYDDAGRVLTETTTRTTPSGVRTLVTTHVYDKAGREVETRDATGAITRTGYDPLGNRAWTMDGLGRTTNWTYDETGRLVRQQFRDSTVETYGYDAEGRRTSMVDRGGRTTTFAYDKSGRLTRTTYVDGGFSERTYDGAGRVLTSREAGVLRTYVYDAAGRQWKEIDALGNERVFTYDVAGRQTKVKDERGSETTFVYDVAGRRTKVINPDLSEKTTAYDLLDRVTAETDEAGRTTQFGHDALGRLTTVTDADNKVTTYAYDERGGRTSRLDAANHETKYEYDDVGRETKRVLPGGRFETKEYDAEGNLKARTDFMGRRTTFTYDVEGRLLNKRYPNSSVVSFTYGPTGRRLTAVDARGTTSYAYDNRDRVIRKTDPTGYALEYGYDVNGRRTRLAVRVGATEKATQYTYDTRGMIQTVTDPDGRVFALEYDAAGAMAKLVRPNGVDTTYTHDGRGWLSNIRTFRRANNETVASYAYTVANTGHRTRIEEADGTVRAYGYDALYRLTTETVTGGTGPQYAKTFAYDAVSNRTQQVTTGFGAATVDYTYDGRQRLLTENGVAYAWDDNGNQLGKTGGDAYEWDFDDRLVKVTKPDGTVLENTYDVDGVLVRTRVVPAGEGAAEVTELVVDTAGPLSHVVGEVTGGALGVVYMRAGDMLVGEVRGGVVSYHEAEGIGSIRRVLDQAGTETDTFRFSAFGETLTADGPNSTPYRFAGERFVRTAGLYQNRARWLDAKRGAFLSADRMRGHPRAPLTSNPTMYAHADPCGLNDPTGYFAQVGLSFVSSTFSLASGMGQLAGLLLPSSRIDSPTNRTCHATGRWSQIGRGVLETYARDLPLLKTKILRFNAKGASHVLSYRELFRHLGPTRWLCSESESPSGTVRFGGTQLVDGVAEITLYPSYFRRIDVQAATRVHELVHAAFKFKGLYEIDQHQKASAYDEGQIFEDEGFTFSGPLTDIAAAAAGAFFGAPPGHGARSLRNSLEDE